MVLLNLALLSMSSTSTMMGYLINSTPPPQAPILTCLMMNWTPSSQRLLRHAQILAIMCLAVVFKLHTCKYMGHPLPRSVTLELNVESILSLVQILFGIMTASTVQLFSFFCAFLLPYRHIGLIQWKIVMHAFIDGFSWLITGIHASNNNHAQTVLNLFTTIIDVWCMPGRTRGDHRIENLLVAACMEAAKGIEHDSYIWRRFVSFHNYVVIHLLTINRSVHNIHTECLWCNITQGFEAKWKRFFQDLELHNGLIVNRDAHIWLIHHLFLPAINSDAKEWADTWNNHLLSFHGEYQRSPADMYLFGMIQNGP